MVSMFGIASLVDAVCASFESGFGPWGLGPRGLKPGAKHMQHARCGTGRSDVERL